MLNEGGSVLQWFLGRDRQVPRGRRPLPVCEGGGWFRDGGWQVTDGSCRLADGLCNLGDGLVLSFLSLGSGDLG